MDYSGEVAKANMQKLVKVACVAVAATRTLPKTKLWEATISVTAKLR